MAEVRQIPSAVGAFEAQVIDIGRTYNAIVQNAASIRRRQAQAQKDIEKQMDVALADKRTIRPQDSDVVENKRQDVYNYYFNNRDAVISGGSALGELKMKMGEFTSLVTQSSSLSKKNQQLLPVLNKALDPKNEMAPELTSIVDSWNMPIGEERKKKTFLRDGAETSIDELDVTDLKYYEKFDESRDLDKVITTNVKPFPVEKVTLQNNKKLGIYVDQIEKIQMYRPQELVNQVVSVAFSKGPGFVSNFDKQLAAYNAIPEEDRKLEYKSVEEAYKELSGFDINTYFKKEGGPGIDNALEFAVFKNLQSNMPQIVKDAYDYRTQRTLLAQWQYGLGRARFANQLKKDEEAEGIDANLTKAIKSRKFDADFWNDYMNGWANVGYAGAEGVRAGTYNFSKPDSSGKVTVTYEVQVPLRDADFKVVTTDASRQEAEEYLKKTAGIKGANPNTKLGVAGNIWYATTQRTVILDPKSANLAPDVSNMNSYMENAIPVPEAKDRFKQARQQKTVESKQFIPQIK